MKKKLELWIVVVGALVLMLAAAGCSTTGPPIPPPEPVTVHVPPVIKDPTGAGGEEVDPPPKADDDKNVKVVVNTKLEGRLSRAAKQKLVQQTLLGLQRTIISTREQLKLSGGAETTTVAKDELTTRLAEIGLKVIETTESLTFNPTEGRQDAFRKANDCNIVFLADGAASKVDKFGNFWSFRSELKGKLLNLTTHQVIASKTISKRGKRALDERAAAQDAQRAAAADLAKYLTGEAVRWWEKLSLIRKTLVVDGVDSAKWANYVRQELQRRVGVFYVSLESWDPKAEKATYDVLYRFDVERYVTTYIAATNGMNLKVTQINSSSETIKACEAKGGILHWLGL